MTVISEAAKRLSGIHNHSPVDSAPIVVMDSGLAPSARPGATADHFPLNTGLRFSTKAFCASFASSVCESSTVTDCSKR